MNRRELQRNVARGVRLLDEKDPLWWNGGKGKGKPMIDGMVGHIDLDTLDLASGNRCILGQRCRDGMYVGGVNALGLTTTSSEQYGFNVWHRDPFGRPDFQDEESSSRLTELWVSVIQSRRFPRRKIASEPWIVRANKTWVRSIEGAE